MSLKLKTAAADSSILDRVSRGLEVLGGVPGIAGTAMITSTPYKCLVSQTTTQMLLDGAMCNLKMLQTSE